MVPGRARQMVVLDKWSSCKVVLLNSFDCHFKYIPLNNLISDESKIKNKELTLRSIEISCYF